MTEQEVAIALSKKYPSPQYAFLTHVRNQTGYGNLTNDSVRTADALALGLWKSRGYNLEGFEIKVSREDWIKEWKDPEKAEAIAKYCDYWWIVVSDSSIIHTGELPTGWGLKSMVKGHIVTLQNAERNLDVEPMSRMMLCGFMRKMDENIKSIYTPTIEVEKKIKERVENEVKYRLSRSQDKTQQYEEIIKKCNLFKQITGIDIDMQWQNDKRIEEIGEAVKSVLNGQHKRILQDIIYYRDSIKRLLDQANNEINKLQPQ